MSILDCVAASHRCIHDFASVVSRLDLEELYLSWHQHPDCSPARSHDALLAVTDEVEALFFVYFGNTVVLPGLRKFTLSASEGQTVYVTEDALSKFLAHTPLLESIAIEDVCLGGRWDPIFSQFQSSLPELNSVYLESLEYWNRDAASSNEELHGVTFRAETGGWFLEREGPSVRDPITYQTKTYPGYRGSDFVESIIHYVQQPFDPDRLRLVLDGVSENVLTRPQFNPEDPSNALAALDDEDDEDNDEEDNVNEDA